MGDGKVDISHFRIFYVIDLLVVYSRQSIRPIFGFGGNKDCYSSWFDFRLVSPQYSHSKQELFTMSIEDEIRQKV